MSQLRPNRRQICMPQMTQDVLMNRTLSFQWGDHCHSASINRSRWDRKEMQAFWHRNCKITRINPYVMKHLVDICVNPQLLGGRLSLETYPICHCISLLPRTIPEEYQPLSQPRGEIAPSNLMPLGVRKWPVVILCKCGWGKLQDYHQIRQKLHICSQGSCFQSKKDIKAAINNIHIHIIHRRESSL